MQFRRLVVAISGWQCRVECSVGRSCRQSQLHFPNSAWFRTVPTENAKAQTLHGDWISAIWPKWTAGARDLR